MREHTAAEIKDIYDAEKQLTRALPKLIKAATAADLKKALSNHLKETEGHVKRLDTIGQALGIKLTGKKCKAMEGLVEEGKEILDEDGQSPIIDAALIGAAQRVVALVAQRDAIAEDAARHRRGWTNNVRKVMIRT